MYRPLSTRFGTAMAVADRLRSLAREQTEQALNIILGIMNAPTTSDRDKLTAAFGILDRGWGKPKEMIEAEGGTTVRQLTYKIVHVDQMPKPVENDDDLVVDFHEIKNGNGDDRAN